ncbi:nitrite reductase/ring-hydroxylating ferredoxin subunit [Paenibacillus phyllosphaerae]|uniref:Nitrite reductase/ring-hydroxylating ferredoxin subunit n=1 Tax=Paenibacillus phyllosphaerae TaxID=274593 RepID=A0A7W5FQC7_9BACL|nr:nitrite reductase (NAD(P)H) small subunit [Paenibacillus phyllosphaerae]MBB3113335.1 nitrite reductase/ring-hydroxylating ferredoxin subunit [Paenibacillus phyllosphaerae]
MRYYHVGSVELFPMRLGRVVRLNDQQIAVFRTTEGKLYALENRSPGPKGGTIVEGIVAGEVLYDPICDWKIGLPDGCVLPPDEGKVRSFLVDIRDGEVYVGMEE